MFTLFQHLWHGQSRTEDQVQIKSVSKIELSNENIKYML